GAGGGGAGRAAGGAAGRAAEPLARFAAWADATGQPWARAVLHRCRALAGDGDADGHFREALRQHEVSGRPFEHARTALLYGEWLRRARRGSDAPPHLRTPLALFDPTRAPPSAQPARPGLHPARAPPTPTAPAAGRLAAPS